jgi:zinc transport system substrate-binding protein
MQYLRKLLFLALCLMNICYAEEKPYVLVSIPTYQNLLQELLGDDFVVESIVPEKANFHSYEPTIKRALTYSKASLWLTIGDPFELRLEKFFQNQPHCPTILRLTTSLSHHSDSCCQPATMDPHPWTSPKEVRSELRNILPKLVEMFPDKKEKIEANFAKLDEKFLHLISTVDTLLKDVAGKPLFVAHAAFGYLCKEYGMYQVALESGGKEATPALLQHILEEGKRHHVTTVFALKGYSKKGIESVGKALDASVVELDPYLCPYFESMVQTAAVIKLSLEDEES